MIIWFTGQPGSGKTTLAEALIERIGDTAKCIHIDGDRLRKVFNNQDYSTAGRLKNMTDVVQLAQFLHSEGFVVVISVIGPYSVFRRALVEECGAIEVYLHTTELRGRENYHVEEYEIPLNPCLNIDTTNIIVEDAVGQVFNVYRTISTFSFGSQVGDRPDN